MRFINNDFSEFGSIYYRLLLVRTFIWSFYSTLINLNVLKVCSEFGIEKVLYTSSIYCVYPEYNQMDENNIKLC